MATYFDIDNETHLRLLPPAFRDHPDLEITAENAEADVIEQFTGFQPDSTGTARQYSPTGTEINTDTDLYVFLDEYETDASAADADFATAMRRTIADVIVHRLRTNNLDPLLRGMSVDVGQQRSYTKWSASVFPKNWARRLTPYDTREGAWGL